MKYRCHSKENQTQKIRQQQQRKEKKRRAPTSVASDFRNARLPENLNEKKKLLYHTSSCRRECNIQLDRHLF